MSSNLAHRIEDRITPSRRVHWNPFLVQNLRISQRLSNLNFVGRMARLFYLHGRFCASHPWEVMVTFLSLAICMFTMGPYVLFDQNIADSGTSTEIYFSEMGHSSHSRHSMETNPFNSVHPSNTVSNEPPNQHLHHSTIGGNGESNIHHHHHHHHPFYSHQCDQSSYCSSQKNGNSQNGLESSEVVILTISRCLALLYVYHQFRNLYKLGSKYLVGIAGLFTVFSSFIFCSGVVNFLNGNLSVLNKALPFFILLSDLSKASLLAQFALSSSTRDEVHENIARGMATLGPSLTLDTLVETLAIGMGTITGFPRLEEISYFSCMTYLVNYVVFMTFFPAALALALELAHDREGVEAPVWQFASLAKVLQLETDHTPNPVIQRVKLVMSAGLMLVHTLRRWPLTSDNVDQMDLDPSNNINLDMSSSEQSNGLFSFLNHLTSTGTDQILVIGFVCALTIKYIFFESKDVHNVDVATSATTTVKYGHSFENVNKSDDESKDMLTKDDNESTSGVSFSNSTTSSTPSSSRPTTPTASSTTSDELDNSRMSKPATPSIMITTQDSDTESVIAEYRRKLSESRILLASDNSSNESSRAGSVKGVCVHHRNHRNHHAVSSGHGSATDETSSMPPSLSECDVGSNHSQSVSPSFFIGDDFCSECFSNDPTEYVDREVQTDFSFDMITPQNEIDLFALKRQSIITNQDFETKRSDDEKPRDLHILLELLAQTDGCSLMSDQEVQILVEKQHIPAYKLETILGNAERGVAIRRRVIESSASRPGVLENVPYLEYDYNLVLGACCENVIGYLPLPLGVAGPLLLNGRKYYVPMATTEGCLVASTNRGCRAVSLAGGLRAKIYADGMTRGPVLHFRSAMDAAEAMEWLSISENFDLIKAAFDSTSRFARLEKIHARVAARYLYLRFSAKTGDAMGMNMLSKGTERALEELSKYVHGLEMKCLSGNFCTDKKPSSVNWIEGRGKSVVCETIVPRNIVEKVLKTTVEALVGLNTSKNLIGSAVAGSIGGNNAQAANIVAAIFIATGQDPAQTVGSSNCLTIMESCNEDLYISCTMPSIEVGTIGGGTVLGPQGACLQLLGLKGCSPSTPGSNSSELAQVVCGTVLAAELSLLSALAAGHLVRSHMKHNRSNVNINMETTSALLLSKSKCIEG